MNGMRTIDDSKPILPESKRWTAPTSGADKHSGDLALDSAWAAAACFQAPRRWLLNVDILRARIRPTRLRPHEFWQRWCPLGAGFTGLHMGTRESRLCRRGCHGPRIPEISKPQ